METLFPINKGAYFSLNREYRFALWRIWDESKPLLFFIGLNPSTADGETDDPTIRRCIGFCRDFGYGGFYIGNLFAYRATDPLTMKQQTDPVGVTNNYWLEELRHRCERVVFIWGVHGSHLKRDQQVIAAFPDAYCLGKTSGGHPRHPLYLPRLTGLRKFN
ncbi:DUF1643 domain-containing protein [Spirosoma sp. BT702]|uniref:DUF1643 domain-containing protein n=1 Tax=Spirosoma profusum TaxID=2771354 RepID=A0A927ARR4_9BACT|nr:DUF1643 domain-containing protein [Spirosoma profusum]MBD2700125.1 DUF1643 domain-containing protein [Spirosoma profusum]